jgi:hypothetical protein
MAKQTNVATVVGTITLAGNATVTVTSAVLPGSPKAFSVAVNLSDTAAIVAQDIRYALAIDTNLSSLYVVGGTTTSVQLTARVDAPNDATLNIAIANGTCTGLTAAPTSTTTVTGSALGLPLINPYCSLTEFKNYATQRGQQTGQVIDAIDDTIAVEIINGISRDIDDQCHRTFYPRFETRYFSVPVYTNSPRLLFLDDDLLEEVQIINGDTTDITSLTTSLGGKVYNLRPKNISPHYAIQLIGPTYIFWIFNGIGAIEWVISVKGWWGFHNQYIQRGWTAIDTLSAAITDTTGLTMSTALGSTFTNDIFKIDTEIFNAANSNQTTGVITVNQRGDNGSTAATHLNGATLYRWAVQPEIKQIVLETVLNIYQTRAGQSSNGRISFTQAGIVIRPQDYSDHAQKVITSFTRPVM